ncbi:MAG: hypothetical protein FWG28_04565 [Clostridiales bacterium]|nr:hypothetical protein [Clostridiales bacterium]
MSEADSRRREEAPSTGSLLDMLEETYPEKVGGLFGGLSQIGKLLTFEDWLAILTRSRSSFESARNDKK